MSTPAPVAEIDYSGPLTVQPYRRGTYAGDRLLDQVIEQALGAQYSFGRGWEGHAEIAIRLFERESVRSPMPDEGDGAIRAAGRTRDVPCDPDGGAARHRHRR
jgi:hypothetical protein